MWRTMLNEATDIVHAAARGVEAAGKAVDDQRTQPTPSTTACGGICRRRADKRSGFRGSVSARRNTSVPVVALVIWLVDEL